MIVWGGTGAAGELNSGARYNPATDTWTAMTMTNAPGPRRGHAAVWTGTAMVIWAGYDSGIGNWRNDAASYDPATDTWTALPGGGAPSARSRFAYAWDAAQTELIIFAGWTAGGGITLVNDASRLVPGMPWQGTTGSGLSARYYLHGFMTGVGAATRFIAWGGEVGNGGTLQTGARYNPANDTWAAMTNVGRPTARSRYMGVSTGNNVIFWGGWDGGAVRSDGALYDPVADSWTTLGGGPGGFLARSVATAVWTGTEMVVFGGADDPTYPGGTVFFNDTAAYATLSNTWRSISPTNAPSVRADHTAVWSGTEMIVWGGTSNGVAVRADGARLGL